MVTDCQSEVGVTVGIIDGIITFCQLLQERDLDAPEIQEALADLQSHAGFKLLQPESDLQAIKSRAQILQKAIKANMTAYRPASDIHFILTGEIEVSASATVTNYASKVHETCENCRFSDDTPELCAKRPKPCAYAIEQVMESGYIGTCPHPDCTVDDTDYFDSNGELIGQG